MYLNIFKKELDMYVYLCSCNYRMHLPLAIILCKNLYSFLKTNIYQCKKNNLRSSLVTSHEVDVFSPSPLSTIFFLQSLFISHVCILKVFPLCLHVVN